MAEIPASFWIGTDEAGGIPNPGRPDVDQPPHWRLDAVAATERPRHLEVSPDGSSVALTIDRDTSDMWLLAVDGGLPVRLTTDRTSGGVLGGRRAGVVTRRDTDRLHRLGQGDDHTGERWPTADAVRGIIAGVARRATARDRRRPRKVTERDDGAGRDRRRRSVAGAPRRRPRRPRRDQGVARQHPCGVDAVPPRRSELHEPPRHRPSTRWSTSRSRARRAATFAPRPGRLTGRCWPTPTRRRVGTRCSSSPPTALRRPVS